MRYLTGVSNMVVKAAAHPLIGLMCQPGNSYHLQIEDYPFFAVDNGAYGGKFHRDKWLRLVDRAALHADRLLFVAAPDRFDPNDLGGNLPGTLEMWGRYSHEILDRGLPAAFVCQDGCTPDDIPAEASAVFIGGSTWWKLSERAWACVAAAKAHGQWAHLGRVNSGRRSWAADISLVDSVDGTYIKHGPPALMLAEIIRWVERSAHAPTLPLFGGLA